MTGLRYHVVAMSMPMVYTLDGDHDRDGLLFALDAHRPLLEWAKARWEEGGERLPRLHFRRQRAQLVVDGLDRLERMLDRLRHGPDSDQDLLAELLRREHIAEYAEAEDRLSHGPRRRGGRSGAVRLNVQNTLDELRVALADLGDTGGPPKNRRPVEAGEPDPDTPIRLVSLTTQERAEWRSHWQEQLHHLEQAIDRWFAECESDAGRAFSASSLAVDSGMPPDLVRRWLLNDHREPGSGAYDRFNPLRPIPLLEPLVLRANEGDPISIRVENSLKDRPIVFHVQGGGLTHRPGFERGEVLVDGPRVQIGPGAVTHFEYAAEHQGVWPINDLADVRGNERGSNAHGLFGAIVVEPPQTTWFDPVLNLELKGTGYDSGLYVDVIPEHELTATRERDHEITHPTFVDFHSADTGCAFREFTVFIHDEPEIHSGLHATGEHTVMPLSYRAEPMHNRLPHRMRRYAERTARGHRPEAGVFATTPVDRTAVKVGLGDELEEVFWTALSPEGEYLERVAGEEQHHSSWLFGDPVTPLLRAYRGDPARIRLVHAGVKETHVFHLHVHQWHAVAEDAQTDGMGSHLLDSITIGPQSGITIDPLYGSGSRQHAVGDIIWHCHLYPHFHHGMWGLWRSYDRLVGEQRYPDGSPCPALVPLPGRVPPAPEPGLPGFPWFVDGVFPMKSPPPPAAVDVQVNGRRTLLRMPLASQLERNAMHPSCRDGKHPGDLFCGLDEQAERWGLPHRRIVTYDIEVSAARVDYNVDGWHDPRGHRYRLLAASIRHPDGTWIVAPKEFEADRKNPEPLYPRANHGDIVELRLHNALTSFPADQYDVGQAAVECGLHVHLVKFDVLAADGSSTGWNYLSGASCREAVGADHPNQQRTVSLHRWVVDQEFGPCFFHDHLLANFRQKHGLFSALIAEPRGSQWTRPEDPEATAWGTPQAIVIPDPKTKLPPYREACLGVGDFVPLLDKGGRALNPPTTLSGDDDPGSMGVNYRSAPLTFRGKDPSHWFSTSARSTVSMHATPGDPDTELIRTYPGERLRLRLIQGSHEENHSFSMHGLRWRRDWGNRRSPLTNQQSLGISEAFTFDIDPEGDSPYGVGDHLWQFGAMDDLWVGCWGYVRVLRPTDAEVAAYAPLPDLVADPERVRRRLSEARPVPSRPGLTPDGRYTAPVRTVVVVARRTEHLYRGHHLTDPWGLRFVGAEFVDSEYAEATHTGRWQPAHTYDEAGPLVMRVRRGEWLRVFVVNEVLRAAEDEPRLPRFGVEPSPPRLPLEHLDENSWPDRRTITPRVSLHAALLGYEVNAADGANVGRNVNQTVPPLRVDDGEHGGHNDGGGQVVRDAEHHGNSQNWREMWWYADPALAPERGADGPGQICYLQDMADVRNHRHHGLFGALVVLPGDCVPVHPHDAGQPAWFGPNAVIRTDDGTEVAHETVAFVQNGLRLFVNGHASQPVPDVVPADDPEDSGQMALSYRTALVHEGSLEAAEALCEVPAGAALWLHAVGACDKPRMQTLTVHGTGWPAARWVPGGAWTGAASGVATGWADTFVVTPAGPGDHSIRSGCFRWGTELGLWGIIRAR